MRWVADGKYVSSGRPLQVMTPVPGRKRTRATACLRRPVVCESGLGICAVLLRYAGTRRAPPGGRGWGPLAGAGGGGAGSDFEFFPLARPGGRRGQAAQAGVPYLDGR